MGKKSSKETQTTTSAPPSWAVPIIQGGAQSVMDTYNANKGNLAGLSSQLHSMLPGMTNTSMLNGGTKYANNVLSGQYLNSNPYVNQMAQFAGQQAGNAVNSAFSSAGRTGSGDHATDLARGVDQAANGVLFQNYQNERGLQNQAASLLPAYQQAQTGANTAALGGIQLAGQLPYYGSQSLGTIGSLLGNYGTSTSSGTKPGGWGNDILGAAMAAAPFVMSDERLKTNIERIGDWDERGDGLGKYRWNWKSSPNGQKVEGVIAQEVEKLRPWAFAKNFIGQYHGVNYAALGSHN